MPKKILVIRGGAVGDFILTLPVLAALRAHFPGARIEILGYPAIASLAVTGGLADSVLPVEATRFTPLFSADIPVPAEIAVWLESFDVVLSYLHDPGKIFQRNVVQTVKGLFIEGPHRPNEAIGVHAAEQLLRPLEALEIRSVDACPKLMFEGSTKKEQRIAIHPGSGSPRKNWPEEKWAALLRRFEGNVLLIGGEAEGGRCARLASVMEPGRAEVAQNMSLPDLARRMQNCSAFAGHDSGITHLAAALDLPGLVLWGETSLTTWRPQSDKMKILRHSGGLQELPVALVERELEILMPR